MPSCDKNQGKTSFMDQLPIEIIGEIFGQLKWKNWALALALTCKKYLRAFHTNKLEYVYFVYKNDKNLKVTIFHGNLILFQTCASKRYDGNHSTILEVVTLYPREIKFPHNSYDIEQFKKSMTHFRMNFIHHNKIRFVLISSQFTEYSFIAKIIKLIKNTPVFDYFGEQLQTIDESINVKKHIGMLAHKLTKDDELELAEELPG